MGLGFGFSDGRFKVFRFWTWRITVEGLGLRIRVGELRFRGRTDIHAV